MYFQFQMIGRSKNKKADDSEKHLLWTLIYFQYYFALNLMACGVG